MGIVSTSQQHGVLRRWGFALVGAGKVQGAVTDGYRGLGGDRLTPEEQFSCGRDVRAGLAARDLLDSPQGRTVDDAERNRLEGLVDAYKAARAKFFETNIALVRSRAVLLVARLTPTPSLDDAVQSGMVGLLTAIDKYDPERQCRFSTMAVWWIDQSIRRDAMKSGSLVRLPEARVAELSKVFSRVGELTETGVSTKMSFTQAVREAGMPQVMFADIINAGTAPLSLQYMYGSSGDGSEGTRAFVDLLPGVASAEECVWEGFDERTVDAALETLPQSQRDAVMSSVVPGGVGVPTRKQVLALYSWTRTEYRRQVQAGLSAVRAFVVAAGVDVGDAAV